MIQRRHLNLQEYQSKSLLDKKGCNVQSFFVAENATEVEKMLNVFSMSAIISHIFHRDIFQIVKNT